MKARHLLLLATALLSACAGFRDRGSESESGYAAGGVYDPSRQQARPMSAEEARTDKNVIGCVKVEYLIKPDGSASDVRIVESVPAGYFDAKVLNAMERIRFQPRNAIAFGTRTFSFAPKQSKEVLDSAAKLCEHSASAPLPPPPEGGLSEDSEPRPIPPMESPPSSIATTPAPEPSSSSSSASTKPRRPNGRH